MRQKAHNSRYINIDLGKEIINIQYKELFLISLAFLYARTIFFSQGYSFMFI